ncbi:hypothetical protein AC529_04525 [Thermobifida cellulosilytica TB100]|uniref:ABC transporter ATP-binding protein n=1 Tax=Thermobifida cellulosilytica TB100 TaxID=665004 RepID=A0A147KKC4_THECS|nr:hypothetical protein AC529_04525 [Thermobifida cellulosilytica TB100]
MVNRIIDPRADRLLLSAASHGRGPLAAHVLALAARSAAGLALPAVLASAVDSVLSGSAVAGPLASVAAVCGLVVLGEAAASVTRAHFTARATARLRRDAVGGLLSGPPRPLSATGGGALAVPVVAGAPEAAGGPVALAQSAITALSALGAVAALGLLDLWTLGAYGVVASFGFLVLWRFMADSTEAAHRYQHAQACLAERLLNSIAGARTIAVSGTAKREARQILAALGPLHAAGRAFWEAVGRATRGVEVLVPAVQGAVLAVAGTGVVQGRLTPGALAAALLYAVQGLAVFDQAALLSTVARARAGAGQVDSLLARPRPRHGSLPLPEGRGELRLEDVTVADSAGRLLLDRVNLVVPGGGVTAVVAAGPQGTAVAWLAARLMDPDSGRVLLDGADLAELRPEELRAAVGYAPSAPRLFGRTLEQAVGGDAPAPDRLQAAARAAAIDDYVARLPLGWHTPLHAVAVSDGERQRLGIARALFREPRLLVAEDATSNLDTVTERLVNRVLTVAPRRGSRLLVTRRASVAARADLVVWFDGPRIRGVAPHRVLVSDPDYRAALAQAPGSGPAPRLAGRAEP